MSRTTYAELFAVIGTTYGSGDGSTTFNLPDLRGRTAVGAGQGAGLSSRSIGQKVGEESHTLTANEIPAHTYTGTTGLGNSTSYRLVSGAGVGTFENHIVGFGVASYEDRSDAAYPGRNHTHNFTTSSVGGGQTHNVMQPSLVINYIIRAK